MSCDCALCVWMGGWVAAGAGGGGRRRPGGGRSVGCVVPWGGAGRPPAPHGARATFCRPGLLWRGLAARWFLLALGCPLKRLCRSPSPALPICARPRFSCPLPSPALILCPLAVGPPLAATEFRLESVPELKYSATDSPAKVPAPRHPLPCIHVPFAVHLRRAKARCPCLPAMPLARLPGCLPCTARLPVGTRQVGTAVWLGCDRPAHVHTPPALPHLAAPLCRARSASGAPWCLLDTTRTKRRPRRSLTTRASSTQAR